MHPGSDAGGGPAGDPYRSRAQCCEIRERVEPVFYGGEVRRPSALTEKDVRHYTEKGFLAFSGFFSAEEIAPVRAEADRLRAEGAERPTPEVVVEPASKEVRSVFAVHQTNPVIHRLCRHPRLLAIAECLLGGRVYVHQSRVNYKPALEGREFFWHSDFETWHMEDGMPHMRALSCSIALSENTEFNGPLMVVPGSHRYFVVCAGETPAEHYKRSLKKQEYGVPSRESLEFLVDEGGIAAPKGPAGSVVFFECNLMHGSAGNLSPRPRTNVFFVYNSVENALVEPFAGIPRRPEYLASRDFTPLDPAQERK